MTKKEDIDIRGVGVWAGQPTSHNGCYVSLKVTICGIKGKIEHKKYRPQKTTTRLLGFSNSIIDMFNVPANKFHNFSFVWAIFVGLGPAITVRVLTGNENAGYG